MTHGDDSHNGATSANSARVRRSERRVTEWPFDLGRHGRPNCRGTARRLRPPLAALAWIGAPLLRDQLGGREPLGEALLILLTLGLIWQFVLVMILARRELGTLQWSRLRDALWLRSPRDPKTGRVGGRVWWWLIPFILIFGIEQLLPAIPGPSVRDFGDFIGSDRGEDFFRGEWGWFAVLVVLVVFNTVLGEELLFRGLLLPRMNGAFGKWDWVANGVLFGPTTCTSPGTSQPRWLTSSPSRIPRGGSRAPGWRSSCTPSSVFVIVTVLTLVA